ncbi:contractile injection system tape measure protein [Janthinobacterium fluminis]|uniref:Contractile injection system tape measure protein n=1 Tax=Janthinobacterium fluminis TaxID=2987524 RepID=A0ABT5K5R1_9BURK|nr:contractile injection system tape measure protein [Janthinobacterium fluminis]MDC8760342.1 contractile injection system tape measure protein [Janthinobacterium fluminis]
MNPAHRIGALHLDLTFESDAPRLVAMAEDQLLALAREQVLPTLELALDEADDGRLRRIGRLDIDLGEIPAHLLDSELPRRLHELLRKALGEALRDSADDAQAGTAAPAGDGAQLERFLRTGRMAGARTAGDTRTHWSHPEGLLAHLLERPDGAVPAMLRRSAAQPGVLKRLAQQFAPQHLRQLLRLAADAGTADGWLALVDDIERALPPGEAARRQQLRLLWELVLAQILGGAPVSATAPLRAAAANAGIRQRHAGPQAAALWRAIDAGDTSRRRAPDTMSGATAPFDVPAERRPAALRAWLRAPGHVAAGQYSTGQLQELLDAFPGMPDETLDAIARHLPRTQDRQRFLGAALQRLLRNGASASERQREPGRAVAAGNALPSREERMAHALSTADASAIRADWDALMAGGAALLRAALVRHGARRDAWRRIADHFPRPMLDDIAALLASPRSMLAPAPAGSAPDAGTRARWLDAVLAGIEASADTGTDVEAKAASRSVGARRPIEQRIAAARARRSNHAQRFLAAVRNDLKQSRTADDGASAAPRDSAPTLAERLEHALSTADASSIYADWHALVRDHAGLLRATLLRHGAHRDAWQRIAERFPPSMLDDIAALRAGPPALPSPMQAGLAPDAGALPELELDMAAADASPGGGFLQRAIAARAAGSGNVQRFLEIVLDDLRQGRMIDLEDIAERACNADIAQFTQALLDGAPEHLPPQWPALLNARADLLADAMRRIGAQDDIWRRVEQRFPPALLAELTALLSPLAPSILQECEDEAAPSIPVRSLWLASVMHLSATAFDAPRYRAALHAASSAQTTQAPQFKADNPPRAHAAPDVPAAVAPGGLAAGAISDARPKRARPAHSAANGIAARVKRWRRAARHAPGKLLHTLLPGLAAHAGQRPLGATATTLTAPAAALGDNSSPVQRIRAALLAGDPGGLPAAMLADHSEAARTAIAHIGPRLDVWQNVAQRYPLAWLEELTVLLAPQAAVILRQGQESGGAGATAASAPQRQRWLASIMQLTARPFDIARYRSALHAPAALPHSVADDQRHARSHDLDVIDSRTRTAFIEQALLDAQASELTPALLAESGAATQDAIRRIGPRADVWRRVAQRFPPALLEALSNAIAPQAAAVLRALQATTGSGIDAPGRVLGGVPTPSGRQFWFLGIMYLAKQPFDATAYAAALRTATDRPALLDDAPAGARLPTAMPATPQPAPVSPVRIDVSSQTGAGTGGSRMAGQQKKDKPERLIDATKAGTTRQAPVGTIQAQAIATHAAPSASPSDIPRRPPEHALEPGAMEASTGTQAEALTRQPAANASARQTIPAAASSSMASQTLREQIASHLAAAGGHGRSLLDAAEAHAACSAAPDAYLRQVLDALATGCEVDLEALDARFAAPAPYADDQASGVPVLTAAAPPAPMPPRYDLDVAGFAAQHRPDTTADHLWPDTSQDVPDLDSTGQQLALPTAPQTGEHIEAHTAASPAEPRLHAMPPRTAANTAPNDNPAELPQALAGRRPPDHALEPGAIAAHLPAAPQMTPAAIARDARAEARQTNQTITPAAAPPGLPSQTLQDQIAARLAAAGGHERSLLDAAETHADNQANDIPVLAATAPPAPMPPRYDRDVAGFAAQHLPDTAADRLRPGTSQEVPDLDATGQQLALPTARETTPQTGTMGAHEAAPLPIVIDTEQLWRKIGEHIEAHIAASDAASPGEPQLHSMPPRTAATPAPSDNPADLPQALAGRRPPEHGLEPGTTAARLPAVQQTTSAAIARNARAEAGQTGQTMASAAVAPSMAGQSLRDQIAARLAAAGGRGKSLLDAAEAHAARSAAPDAYLRQVLDAVTMGRTVDLEALDARFAAPTPHADNLANDIPVLAATAPPAPMPPRRPIGGELGRALAGHPPAQRAALAPLLHDAGDDSAQLAPALQQSVVSLLAGSDLPALLRYARDVVGIAAQHLPGTTADRLGLDALHFNFAWFFVQRRAFAPADYAHALAAHLARQYDAAAAAQLHAALHGRLGIAQPPSLATPPPPATDKAVAAAEIEAETLYVGNAGQVLAGPYMPRLFSILGLTEAGRFKDSEAAERAVHLLQYVVSGQSDSPEYLLGLNKILCGVSASTPIVREIVPSDEEREAIDMMLCAMIEHWKKIGNTSPDGLRQAFLQRAGSLRLQDDAWRLTVEPGAFDMLLDTLPWSFSIIKHPWMERAVHVNWR